MNQKLAIQKIDKNSCLLVFPIKNAVEPKSLWSEFFPRSKMMWDWSDDKNDKVWRMWQLMKKLSDGGEVVYSKWYQSRATFFSKDLFTAMLAIKLARAKKLSPTARMILDLLEDDSPLSTKELKKRAELKGKENESLYQKSLKELFLNLNIVAFGEVDDGAFPSLAVGATKNLFESLVKEAKKLDLALAQNKIDTSIPIQSKMRIFWDKNL